MEASLTSSVTARRTFLKERMDGHWAESETKLKRSAQSIVQSRTGSSEFFLSANSETTNRGLDAPTYTPINDAASNSDQFFRFITQLSPRSTLAFDYSNQFSSSRSLLIPIRTTRSTPSSARPEHSIRNSSTNGSRT